MSTPALIVPTPAFKRRVRPRRGHPLAPAAVKRAPESAAEACRRVDALRGYWQRGAKRDQGPFADPVREALALLEGGPWPADLPLEVAAAAERMLNATTTLVGGIAERYGLAAAVRVKTRSVTLAIKNHRDGAQSYWVLEEAGADQPGMFDLGWEALRRVACAADDASYAASRDVAAHLREDAGPLQRALIAFAFPGEPAWANEDLRSANAAADFTRHVHARSSLLASTDDAKLATEFLQRCEPWGTELAMRFGCDLLLGLGVEAGESVLVGELRRALGRRARASALIAMAAAITSVRSEGVAAALAPALRHDVLGRYVLAYFERAPELARHALGPLAAGKSLLGDAARHVLASVAERPPVDEATASEWPALLRDARWRARWARARPSLEIAPLAYDERIEWAAGEREAVLEAAAKLLATNNARPMTPAELLELKALPPEARPADVWVKWEGGVWSYRIIPDDLALELWSDPRSRLERQRPIWALAKFGEAALAGLFARNAFGESADVFETFLRVDSPRAAEACAHAIARRKAWREKAASWLVRHPRAAAIGLVPLALGAAATAPEADRALLLLAASGHIDDVLEVAGLYGDVAREGIARLLEEDPLSHVDPVPWPAPAPRIVGLPPLRLRSGRALPHEAVSRVLEILRGMRPEIPYAGVELLRHYLDPKSAAELAWALWSTWELRGRRRPDEWMARATALFPDDQTAERLVARAREWAQRDSSACLVAFDVLAGLGPSARMHLGAIADASGLETLTAAADRLLGGDRARDDLVPALGLDARGAARLDLGSRAVTISLDETLRPVAWLEDGRRLAQLPRPSKDDDPELAARALTAWKALCRDAAVIAATQPRRFERAMVEGRRFSAADLDALARHPVLGHVARRLVWGIFAPELGATFRIMEDATLSDDDDRPFELASYHSVGVVHTIALSAELRARWSSLFADYEILQPFEQLAREVYRPDAGLAHGASIRMTTEPIAAASLVALLDARGWRRSPNGYLRVVSRALRLAGGGLARADLVVTPGTPLHLLDHAPPQKLGDVRLFGAKSFRDVVEVDMSELLRDLAPWRAP